MEEPKDGGMGLAYPFECPDCATLVGHTVRGEPIPEIGAPPTVYTSLVRMPATRIPDAERDGIPCYGQRRAAMRGRSPIRSRATFQNAMQRARGDNAGDIALFLPEVIDTWCPACRTRLRIDGSDAVL